MITFAIYTVFVFACGLAIGSTLVRDWLDMPRPRRMPCPTIPLARVLHTTDWRRLDQPTFRRRQIIDVTEQKAG